MRADPTLAKLPVRADEQPGDDRPGYESVVRARRREQTRPRVAADGFVWAWTAVGVGAGRDVR